MRSRAGAAGRLVWSGCCASASRSNGATCRSRERRGRCMSPSRRAVSSASTRAASRWRTRPRFAGPATLRNGTTRDRRCLNRCTSTWPGAAWGFSAGTIVDAILIRAPIPGARPGRWLDEERRQGARPGDASVQQGQPVMFRDEGTYRRGQPKVRNNPGRRWSRHTHRTPPSPLPWTFPSREPRKPINSVLRRFVTYSVTRSLCDNR